MRPERTLMVGVRIGRALFVALAVGLLFSWGQAAFGISRGGMVPKPHVHAFFLGTVSFCVLGLFYSFVAHRRGRTISALSLAIAVTVIWCSFSLMVFQVLPLWLWIVLSTLWFALPATVVLVFFGFAGRLFSGGVWRFTGLTVSVAIVLLIAGRRPLVISLHKAAIYAGERWPTGRHGLDQFRYDFMLWSVAGGPPHNFDAALHRQELVSLGYLQKTNFILRHARINDVVEHAERAHFTDSLCWMIEPAKDEQFFTLTAYSGDMRLWKSVVDEADRTEF